MQERTHRLGIDLGGTKIEATLFGRDGDAALWRHRVATPAGDYRATLAAVAALVQQACQRSGPLAPSIGVGHPGCLTAAGRVKNANSTCLQGQALQTDLEASIDQPVRLANDANCLALSEARDGAGADAAVVFAVILGTGVGAGIAVSGHVLGGPNGLSGEWGHNPLPWADADELAAAPACYCGQRGCIEAWLSGPALAADHVRHGGDPLDAVAIAAAAAEGEPACARTVERHAARLARALASVINLLDPDTIVLAGGLSTLPGLTTAVRTQWSRWVFAAGSSEPPRTSLRLAMHGDASGVRGAAWLWP